MGRLAIQNANPINCGMCTSSGWLCTVDFMQLGPSTWVCEIKLGLSRRVKLDPVGYSLLQSLYININKNVYEAP